LQLPIKIGIHRDFLMSFEELSKSEQNQIEFHSTKWNTSKLTTQPISVDIFPRTRKMCNLTLPYFL